MLYLEEHPVLKRMWNLYQEFLEFFFPPFCLSCEERLSRGDEFFCSVCYRAFEPIPLPLCDVCGAPLGNRVIEKRYCPQCPTRPVYFDQARAPLLYHGPVVQGILALKFRYQIELAEFFARILVYYLNMELKTGVFDAIIPVPLHFRRYVHRGYNQAGQIGKELSRYTGVPLWENLVRRTRHTSPQTRLEHSRRFQNVEGAFELVYPEPIKGKHILLLDDVYTTGSTLNACAKALREGGIGKITALAVCRAIAPP